MYVSGIFSLNLEIIYNLSKLLNDKSYVAQLNSVPLFQDVVPEYKLNLLILLPSKDLF